MGWDAAKDLLNRTVRDTFGEAVVYRHAEGPTEVAIQGVWEMAWVEESGANGIPTSGLKPMLSVRLADLSAEPESGDQVVRQGVTYDVIDCRVDSGGGAVLVLHQVQENEA